MPENSVESLDLFAPDLSQILCCKPDPIGAFPQLLLSNLKTQAWFYFTLCLYFTWYNFVFHCYWQVSFPAPPRVLRMRLWCLIPLWFYLIPFLNTWIIKSVLLGIYTVCRVSIYLYFDLYCRVWHFGGVHMSCSAAPLTGQWNCGTWMKWLMWRHCKL